MNTQAMCLIGAYLLFINLAAFSLYFEDKRAAQGKRWRISNKKLLGIAMIGGSVGSLVGIRAARNKTLKHKFYNGIVVSLIVHIIVIVILVDPAKRLYVYDALRSALGVG